MSDLIPQPEDFICTAMEALRDCEDHRKLKRAFEKLEEALFWISYYNQEMEDLELEKKMSEVKPEKDGRILTLQKKK